MSEDLSNENPLRAFREQNPYAGLGRAVSYLMTKPSFANLKFGFWSRTLVGQINRKHYFLVAEGARVVGFAGWALVSQDVAEAWVTRNIDLTGGAGAEGDCMVINAWAADTGEINRFVLRELRKAAVGLRAAYAKRFYENGEIRPLRIPITSALSSHIEKNR